MRRWPNHCALAIRLPSTLRKPQMQRLTLILPYYNEADFIGSTLASLKAQSVRGFRLVLVDNASTDGSEAIARAVLADAQDIEVEFLHEARPGKLHALMTGAAAVDSEFIATLDADTVYPPHYVGRCLDLFDANPRASCVMAIDLYDPPESRRGRAQRRRVALAAGLFPAKCHTGAYGQAFRTAAYRAAGGYDIARWPFVLEDHELPAQVMRFGPAVYDQQHYCFPSDRRVDRGNVNWSLFEQIVYFAMPERRLGWFFDAFLAPRLRRRGLENINLRDRDWA